MNEDEQKVAKRILLVALDKKEGRDFKLLCDAYKQLVIASRNRQDAEQNDQMFRRFNEENNQDQGQKMTKTQEDYTTTGENVASKTEKP